MRTGSALLHRWSAALVEEYDFTVRHRPGKIQTHVDGLSRLPVGPAPPEDALLHLQVENEEEARRLAQELHTATHLGGQALWKLFSDRYSHKAGRRICIEVAQCCPQCQRGSDYGHRQKPREPLSPGDRGTPSLWTLWVHSLPTADTSSSSCLWIASRDTLCLYLPAIIPQTR